MHSAMGCNCINCSQIRISVDMDAALKYERQGILKKIFFHLVWVPLITILPTRIGILLFTSTSKHTKLIRGNAKTHKSLELMYRYNNSNEGISSLFWESVVMNAAAVRNRLKLVKRELKKAVFEKSQTNEKVRILSIASGSARAIIEVLAELRSEGVFNVEARLVDLSRVALDYSKDLAEEYGVANQVHWVRANVLNVEKYCNGWKPDIIEMVGLLDYFEQPQAIEICGKLYARLVPGGIFITCNVHDNPERRFVRDIVGWDMVYRDACHLAEMLLEGGFNPETSMVIYALPPVLWTHRRVNDIRLKLGGVEWKGRGNTVSLTRSLSLRL